jgi:hypothetical protein
VLVHRPLVQKRQSLQPGKQHLPIRPPHFCDALRAGIPLEVEDAELWYRLEDGEHARVVESVVGEIEDVEGLAVNQVRNVVELRQLVAAQLQRVEVREACEVGDPAQQVVLKTRI